jgi:hypothetical protein
VSLASPTSFNFKKHPDKLQCILTEMKGAKDLKEMDSGESQRFNDKGGLYGAGNVKGVGDLNQLISEKARESDKN